MKKLARQLWSGGPAGRGRSGSRDRSPDLAWLDPRRPERAIRERLGWGRPLLTLDHHQSHAGSALFFSWSPRAAVVTGDGGWGRAAPTYGGGVGVPRAQPLRRPRRR